LTINNLNLIGGNQISSGEGNSIENEGQGLTEENIENETSDNSSNEEINSNSSNGSNGHEGSNSSENDSSGIIPIGETSQEINSVESLQEQSEELLVTEKPTQSETDEEENSENVPSEEEVGLVQESNEITEEGSNTVEESGQPLVESENIGGSIMIGVEAEGSVGQEIQLGTGVSGIEQVISEEVQISGSTLGELQTGGVNQGGSIVDEESSEEGLGIFEESEEERDSTEEGILGGATIFEVGNQGNLTSGGGAETGGQVGISGSSTGEGSLEFNGTIQISGNASTMEAEHQGTLVSIESPGINVEEEIGETISGEGLLQVIASEEILSSSNGSISGVINPEGSIEAETDLEGGVSAEGAASIEENEVGGMDLSSQGQIDQESSEEQEGGEIEVEDSQVDGQENIDGTTQEIGNGGLGASGGEKMHGNRLFTVRK
jgi:hypothetical protein